jgi:hypothetical protein
MKDKEARRLSEKIVYNETKCSICYKEVGLPMKCSKRTCSKHVHILCALGNTDFYLDY